MTRLQKPAYYMKMIFERWWNIAIPFFCGTMAPITVAGPSNAIACFVIITCTFLLASIFLRQDVTAILSESSRTLHNSTAIATAMFFAFALVGLFVSDAPIQSINVWFRTIFYIAIAVIIWGYFSSRKFELQLAFYFLLLMSLFAGTIALISLYAWPGLIGFLTMQGIDIPLTTAQLALKSHSIVMSCLVPIVCWLAWIRGGTWRAFSLAYPAFVYIIGVGANKQAATVTLFCGLAGMLFAIFLKQLSGKSALIIFFSCFFMAITLMSFVLTNLPSVPQELYTDFYFADSVINYHTQVIWALTLNNIVENFWFGIGLNTSNFLPQANAIIPQFNQEYITAHLNNFLLELWLESGILGLISVSAGIGTMLWSIYKRLRAGTPGSVALTGYFAAFWSANLYNFSFWSSWWLILFTVCIAMLFATKPNA